MALVQPDHAQVQLLLTYILQLCRFDSDYDLRDRSRTIKSLLKSEDDNVRAHARTVLLAAKVRTLFWKLCIIGFVMVLADLLLTCY